MKIDIQSTKIELTPAIKKYIEKRIFPLGKLVSRFELEGELTIFIEIARLTKHHKSGEVFYAEATVRMPGRTIRAEETHIDMRAAVDKMKDILKRELRKYKDLEIQKKVKK